MTKQPYNWHLFIDGELYDSAATSADMIELAKSLRPIWPFSVFEYKYGS